MNTKKVIIVARDIPQYCQTVGWYIRTTELSKFLARNACIVHIVYLKRAFRFGTFHFEKNVVKHPIVHPLLYYDLPNMKANQNKKSIYAIITKILKRITMSVPTHLIDYDQISFNRFYKKISQLISTEKINNVIISTPPHSYSLIGIKLKKKFKQGINLIVDLRDPWTKRYLYQSKSKKKQKMDIEHEKEVFLFADNIVVVSQGMKDLYADIGLGKIKVIENGYCNVPAIEPERILKKFITDQRKKNRMIIGYFGTGGIGAMKMAGKDLSLLLDVFSSSKEFFEKIALVLQGDIIISSKKTMYKNMLLLPVNSNIQIRANMKEIDIGLHVYTIEKDADAVMGGKLYEYAASGTPIWALVPGNAKSLSNFKKRLGGGIEITDPHNTKEIKKTLKTMIKNYNKNGTPLSPISSNKIAQFSRDKMNANFLKLLI